MNKALNEAAHITTHLRRLHCYLKPKNPLRLNSADNSFCHNSCSQTKQHAWFREREQSISAQCKVCPVTLFTLTHHRPANFSSYCFAISGVPFGGRRRWTTYILLLQHRICCFVFLLDCSYENRPKFKVAWPGVPPGCFFFFFFFFFSPVQKVGCFISPNKSIMQLTRRQKQSSRWPT